MATSKKAQEEIASQVDDEQAMLSEMPDDFEIAETVIHEAPSTIILEEKGDTFFGQFVKIETIDNPKAEEEKDKQFNQFVFRGRDGKLYALPESYQLGTNAAVFQPDEWYLVTLTGFLAPKAGRNPMKNIKVQHAKRRSA